ncbi:3-hydroxybutyryl-CoA dehydrogenase [Balneolaceae bacterium YR4-1]|uniref:3-hydroxybutyryl-CoA dehydrogenase n=1 Tax=Halalkalibaculum roseum TaxID=2709311 RepID=A0A6M1T4I3_9BACT|nr:3-hydroxybutyryl-CoA dehydrogenase [Halalkalibaculum roseum]
MKKVAVIGGGTMGNGITHVFAMNGIPVNLVEMSEELAEKALSTIEKNLDRMVKKEKIDATEKVETLESITTFTSVEDAVKDVDLVVEAVPENFELKKKVFSKVDEAAPERTILATNTSSISITKIAAATSRPEQFIGMHFFNPVPVMKLVEIVKGFETSEETYETIEETARLLDKTPIPVEDYPGFVSNRVLMPMINEAIYCVHEGVAEPEDVDSVMKLGMAHPMGPLRLADFIGLDVCLDIMNVLYEGFKDPKYRPCPLLVKMVDAGKLGDKTGEGFFEYD